MSIKSLIKDFSPYRMMWTETDLLKCIYYATQDDNQVAVAAGGKFNSIIQERDNMNKQIVDVMVRNSELINYMKDNLTPEQLEKAYNDGVLKRPTGKGTYIDDRPHWFNPTGYVGG